ncbi:MAG TPA: chemotaxis protein CheA [Burkholderiales bacterium]|nr:chemotaxis protein CheA [Burkholderiales bacterium]
MSIDLTRFHESFFTESLDGLDSAESGLLALEESEPTPDRLNAIFRGIHSIKGAAGSLGFSAIADFTHHVEGVLDQLRQGALTPDREALDVLLHCVDYTRQLILAAREKKSVDTEQAAHLIANLQHLTDSISATAKDALEDLTTTDTPKENRHLYRIRFAPSPGFFGNGNDPLRLLRVLDGLGEMTVKADLSKLPTKEFNPEYCYLAWNIELSASAKQSEIEEVFSWVADDCKLEIEAVGQPAAPTPAPAPERRGGDRRKTDRRSGARRTEDVDYTSEIRADRLHVSRDKVDGLINLVGELVITKTMLKQSISMLDPESAARLDASLQQLERNTRDLQDSVMGIRMLPVSHAFGRFARYVRDISHRLGKIVQLEITGAQSELDKSVIEKLVDPLTHLVRNALDHGIESPETRRSVGKSEIATLRLHAQHKAGNIEITVSDDGRGIDIERVEAKAQAAGLLREGEALTQERACELIFEPGFSTAAAINDLSGRGVGLDVVRKNIAALSGSIKIESTPGRGAAFVIRLPLTLAIIDGMTVTVGADTYIVPMTFIVECLQTDSSKLKTVAGRGMLVEVRGNYLPLLRLSDFTGVADGKSFEKGLLLILEADGARLALLVDALVGQEQVVIKSLESNYRKVSYLAGATILGEGRVVLILDVGALVAAARE